MYKHARAELYRRVPTDQHWKRLCSPEQHRQLKHFPCHLYHRLPDTMSSRQELIQWVNDLLLLSYTKVEQLGTGR